MICVLQCSSSSQKKQEPIFVNNSGEEEGSGDEVTEVNDEVNAKVQVDAKGDRNALEQATTH